MQFILILPFALQGIAIFFDEFYFHYKRGLGLWEVIGHPLDTFFVLLTYLYISYFEYNKENLLIFLILSFFSSLLITKDEFVHTKLCDAKENWLHAILFILHPICFTSAGYMWISETNLNFIRIQSLVVFIFMVYQIIYWGLKWKLKKN